GVRRAARARPAARRPRAPVHRDAEVRGVAPVLHRGAGLPVLGRDRGLHHVPALRGPVPPQPRPAEQQGVLRRAPVLRDEELRPRDAVPRPRPVQGRADRVGPGQPLGVDLHRVLHARAAARPALRAVRPAPRVHAGGARDARAAPDVAGPAQHRRVAPGRRRLGSLLNAAPADAGEEIVRVLRVLDGVRSPCGHEAAAAVRLASWCTARWPWAGWSVQRYGTGGANLQAGDPSGVLIYSHLDTSLGGDPSEDRPVTGRADPLPPLKVTSSRVEGFGLGVARGPAAAALLAFVNAASQGVPARLLLAGSGTHRSMLHGTGDRVRSTGLDHY